MQRNQIAIHFSNFFSVQWKILSDDAAILSFDGKDTMPNFKISQFVFIYEQGILRDVRLQTIMVHIKLLERCYLKTCCNEERDEAQLSDQ